MRTSRSRRFSTRRPPRSAGVTDADAKHLDEAFGIKTVRQFGENKYFAVAAALAALGSAGSVRSLTGRAGEEVRVTPSSRPCQRVEDGAAAAALERLLREGPSR